MKRKTVEGAQKLNGTLVEHSHLIFNYKLFKGYDYHWAVANQND